MARTLDQVIAGLPAEQRARVEARARRLIQEEVAGQQDGDASARWPPFPPVRPTDDYYVIDRVAMDNLKRVETALYQAGGKRLTSDQIRDLANMMNANLDKAQAITEDHLYGRPIDL